MFASEPQLVTNGRPQVIVVLLEKARGPIRVASTSEWVVVPPVEQDGSGFWHVGHIRVHSTENVHQFRLDFMISQRFDTLRPVTLRSWVRFSPKLEEGKTYSDGCEQYARSREEVLVIETLPNGEPPPNTVCIDGNLRLPSVR